MASLCEHGVLIWENASKARLEFPGANDFIWTEAQQPWVRDGLEKFLRGHLNRAIELRVVATTDSTVESPYAQQQRLRDERRQRIREAMLQHPLIQVAKEILGAETVDVEVAEDET